MNVSSGMIILRQEMNIITKMIMKEYIPKVTVVAEIKRLIAAFDKCPKLNDTQIAVLAGDKALLLKLLSFLDTLEVKRVDLEKEIQTYKDNHSYMSEYIRDVAKHFFELGLAQKGE